MGLDVGVNFYAYVDNNPVRWVDPFGLTKGGQQNISVTHEGKTLNLRSTIKEVQEALQSAIKNGMSSAHINSLRGLLKVIKRGGAMCVIGALQGLVTGIALDALIEELTPHERGPLGVDVPPDIETSPPGA